MRREGCGKSKKKPTGRRRSGCGRRGKLDKQKSEKEKQRVADKKRAEQAEAMKKLHEKVDKRRADDL